jgi:probable rRNA maturation factor
LSKFQIDCPAALRAAALAALQASGLDDGHLSVEIADPERMTELNRRYRGAERATDVIAFPIDGRDPSAGPRELGDVVVCPAYAGDLEEAVVHGVLHLAGYDHETDRGEMLALQRRVLAELRRSP